MTAGLSDEPTSFLCKYESDESIYFHKNASPGSDWMRDVLKLFLMEFPGQDVASLSGIVRFAYWHSGMAKPDIYGLTIDRYDDKYVLRRNFLTLRIRMDPELVWDTEEYRDAIKTFYAELWKFMTPVTSNLGTGLIKQTEMSETGICSTEVIEFEDGKSIGAYGQQCVLPSDLKSLNMNLKICWMRLLPCIRRARM